MTAVGALTIGAQGCIAGRGPERRLKSLDAAYDRSVRPTWPHAASRTATNATSVAGQITQAEGVWPLLSASFVSAVAVFRCPRERYR
jgi:hypothetical protein